MLLAELAFPGWDPVAIHLGPLEVRWYGLGYLAGFLFAGIALDKLGRDGFVALTKTAVSDLIGWLVIGVLVGARVGFALFYDRRLLTDPVRLVKIWEGGLSFHGGLLGVVVASALFARRRGIPWRRLADALSLAVPFGILVVRCANFVNAELYGRVAPPALPWAMRFPTDPVALLLSGDLRRAGGLNWHQAYQLLRADGRWAEIARSVPPRHPSQLYEAALEGLVVGALVWVLYSRRGRVHARPGGIAAAFLAAYATSRFLVEFTRQPDPRLGLVLGPLSMGQLLSAALAVGAAAMLWWPRRAGRGAASAPAPPAL